MYSLPLPCNKSSSNLAAKVIYLPTILWEGSSGRAYLDSSVDVAQGHSWDSCNQLSPQVGLYGLGWSNSLVRQLARHWLDDLVFLHVASPAGLLRLNH